MLWIWQRQQMPSPSVDVHILLAIPLCSGANSAMLEEVT